MGFFGGAAKINSSDGAIDKAYARHNGLSISLVTCRLLRNI